jgi:nitrate reductase NapAB chaperone NapD
MARLSSFKVLNLVLVLTIYRVVVAKFLELAAVTELIELPTTEVRTAERVATIVVVAEIAALELDSVESL